MKNKKYHVNLITDISCYLEYTESSGTVPGDSVVLKNMICKNELFGTVPIDSFEAGKPP
jgi:hypothetical protein